MTEIQFRCKDCEHCAFLMYRCMEKEKKISPHDEPWEDFKLKKGEECDHKYMPNGYCEKCGEHFRGD